MIRLHGRWLPAHRAERVYHELPFEVPERCPGVRIALEYDRTAGVLDLGCTDPLGWRGWSGGARSQVVLAPDVSTPGYADRGLAAGRWSVVLGLHRLPAEGLDYAVTVAFEAPERPAAVAPPPLPARPPRRRLPAADGLSWFAGDLHAHTVHSDGALTIDAVAALAVGAGLDFLAVTDHNTVSHHPLLPAAGRRAGITLLPGQEVTTADGHANAFGDIGWIDFRRPADDWVTSVAARGGVLSVNHPIGYDCAWRHRLTHWPRLAEVWHSSWRDRRDGGPLAWWAATGRTAAPVGGSDWHRPGHDAAPGTPTTWVAATAPDDLIGGLAAGRTAISAGRDGPLLLRVGDELVALEAEGAHLVCPDGRRTSVRRPAQHFSGHPEPHLIETDDRTVLAVAA